MLHKLNKLVFLCLLFSLYLPYAHSSENNLSKGTSSQSIDYDKSRSSYKEVTLTDRFLKSFSKYRSFEEGTKPENQFAELFGFGGFNSSWCLTCSNSGFSSHFRTVGLPTPCSIEIVSTGAGSLMRPPTTRH